MPHAAGGGPMKLSEIDLTNLDTFVRGEQYEAWRVLRAEAPVYWHERKSGAGLWGITRYDDALTGYHDPDTYSSERGVSLVFSAAGASGKQSGFCPMMSLNDPPRPWKNPSLIH